MRIRVIQPAFYDTEQIGALSWDARLVLIGLWSYVRDEGVGKDNLGQIVGALFPFDADKDYEGTRQRVSDALDELCAAGMLIRFEAAGVKYVEIGNWPVWQKPDRPGKVRFPTSAGVSGDSSRESRESLPCGVRSAEYGVRSSEFGVRSTEFGDRSAEGRTFASTPGFPSTASQSRRREKNATDNSSLLEKNDAALHASGLEHNDGITNAETAEPCTWCGETEQHPLHRPFCSAECCDQDRAQRRFPSVEWGD